MSADSAQKFFEDFFDEYFAECEEHLTSARASMLEIEGREASSTSKERALDDLLRNFHSIKGLSAMVGIEEVTQLSHHLEDYLRKLKQPGHELGPEAASPIRAGMDAIERTLNAARSSQALPDVTSILLLLSNASAENRPKSPAKPSAATPSSSTEPRWRFEFRPSAELAERGVTVTTVRERLAAVGQVQSASPLVLPDGGVAFEFIVATHESSARLEELRPDGVICTPLQAETIKDSNVGTAATAAATNLVRVDMSRLDDLMRIAGELLISRSRLQEALLTAERNLPPTAARPLQDINASMERQIRELRQSVLRARMVPIGQIFDRMRFVARGLERETQKRIRVDVLGHETELDKFVVEKMMDPLLHLVRNAISHGIEPAEQRLAAGKSVEGVICLSASTAGDTVIVRVEDDGRGIDLQKVEVRARSAGLLSGDQPLDRGQLLDVICSPGFTTREAADLASGRGVGMASVLSAVTEMGGVMSLETMPGRGTRFAIQLPLTLTIADSLLVTVEGQRFAIPQTSINEVFAIDSGSFTVFENNEAVPYRGGVLPVLRLAQLFGMKPKAWKRVHIMVTGNGENAIGLAVDRVNGQREVVVRTIKDPMLRIPGVTGATELGDGRPVLILDVHALLRSRQGRAAGRS